jgi:hypothetical protein
MVRSSMEFMAPVLETFWETQPEPGPATTAMLPAWMVLQHREIKQLRAKLLKVEETSDITEGEATGRLHIRRGEFVRGT